MSDIRTRIDSQESVNYIWIDEVDKIEHYTLVVHKYNGEVNQIDFGPLDRQLNSLDIKRTKKLLDLLLKAREDGLI